MSARSHRIPAYRLHKPTGLAVVTLDGKDHYLGKHKTEESKAEYQRLIAEWAAKSFARYEAPESPSVTEVSAMYLEFASRYYVKNGRQTSEVLLIKLSLQALRREHKETLARDFGPLALKKVRNDFIKSGLSRGECNRRVGLIVRCFRWATENELVPPTVLHGLKSVPGLRCGRCEGVRETEPIKPVPDASVDAVLPHVSRQIRAMIQLQRLSGMRPGEVTIMRACDLDTSGAVWTYTPGSHKTEHHGRTRMIFLGPQSQAILGPWLTADPVGFLFKPSDAVAEQRAERRAARKTPIQPSHRVSRGKAAPKKRPGQRYDVNTYRNAIKAGCKKAGVPNWGPNRLRHNAATALRREFGLDAARTILGHSTPVVTEVYAEQDFDKARGIMERVG